MRIVILAAVVAALATTPASAATRTVRIDDNYFVRSGSAPTVEVAKGTVVKWRWRGTRRHNVTVETGPRRFHSKTKRSGRFERTLRVIGTYRIVCTVHDPAMAMWLVVE